MTNKYRDIERRKVDKWDVVLNILFWGFIVILLGSFLVIFVD